MDGALVHYLGTLSFKNDLKTKGHSRVTIRVANFHSEKRRPPAVFGSWTSQASGSAVVSFKMGFHKTIWFTYTALFPIEWNCIKIVYVSIFVLHNAKVQDKVLFYKGIGLI